MNYWTDGGRFIEPFEIKTHITVPHHMAEYYEAWAERTLALMNWTKDELRQRMRENDQLAAAGLGGNGSKVMDNVVQAYGKTGGNGEDILDMFPPTREDDSEEGGYNWAVEGVAPHINPPPPMMFEAKKGAFVPAPFNGKVGDVFASKTEAEFLPWLLKEYPDAEWIKHELQILRIDSGNYTPDYWVKDNLQRVHLFEVKSAKGFQLGSQGGRDSRTRFLQTYERYQCELGLYHVWLATKRSAKDGGGFKLTHPTKI